MIKANKVKLNICSFMLKTALAIVSIVVTLALLLFFNQCGLALRNTLLQNEMLSNPLDVMRFNEKEIERVITGYISTLIIPKSLVLNFFIFMTCICIGVGIIVYFLLVLIIKNAQVKSVKYSVDSQPVTITTKMVDFIVFNKLNTKLTI